MRARCADNTGVLHNSVESKARGGELLRQHVRRESICEQELQDARLVYVGGEDAHFDEAAAKLDRRQAHSIAAPGLGLQQHRHSMNVLRMYVRVRTGNFVDGAGKGRHHSFGAPAQR